jgi:hypothetical protein
MSARTTTGAPKSARTPGSVLPRACRVRAAPQPSTDGKGCPDPLLKPDSALVITSLPAPLNALHLGARSSPWR